MKVLIFPKSVNPYHELLYSRLRAAHPKDTYRYLAVTPFTLALFPVVALIKRLQGYQVFHLHWHTFYLDDKYHVPGNRFISFVNTMLCLRVIKLLGYKLVWTVHNVVPHEPKTTSDLAVTRLTVRLASKIIVHSEQTIQEMREAGLDTSKTVIIPHGNYDGVYSRTLTRKAARQRLKIRPDEKVVLFFGNIRPHKGLEGLLAAFERMTAKNVRLLIAGASRDAALHTIVSRFAAKHKDVIFADGNIADQDVAMYFDASDVVCMPFTATTTSGSVILATTFGKPVVAPRLGAIQDIPPTAGELYDPAQKDALALALQKILKSPRLSATSKASRAYADTLDWKQIAKKTHAIYLSALAGKRTS